MKYLSLLLVICSMSTVAMAHHVKGGYIRYEYTGAGSTAGTSVYRVTVTVFYGCGVQGPRGSVTLYALNAVSGGSVLSSAITTTTSKTVSKGTFSPCFSNPPSICYEVYTYVTSITLADNTEGYILGVTDQYRTDNIINIANSSSTGIAFTAQIPGILGGKDYHTNTSPVFDFKDTAIVCYNGNFTYQLSANDPVDHDSLSYSFGNGLNSAGSSAAPFYASLTYVGSYSGASPMGGGVTIDPITGLISGQAPATVGEYVIAVYVSEWRNGVRIDSIKKELQIYVYDCSLTAAILPPSYINCKDKTFTFINQSSAANITAYSWDFGVPYLNNDVSTLPTPTYTYPDSGTFVLKLKVSNGNGCEDSTKSTVKVYPGFTPDFTVAGSCYQTPFVFQDATYAQYGTVNSWHWNFGDLATTSDNSTVPNPTYQYPKAGTATVTLIVGSSKGCVDTVVKNVVINDKPQIILPFTDTLICSGDTLPLIAKSNSTATFSWRPLYNIINPATANPSVYPNDTTVYTVRVQDKACVDSAIVKVNVLQFITVKLPVDTAICATDAIVLHPASYALSYLWTESGPGNSLLNNNVKYPVATPQQTTTYTVTANLGHCQDHTQTVVYVSPYPKVTVSADVRICYGASTTIHGYTTAPYFSWSPTLFMENAATFSPTVTPVTTIPYSISVTDTFYCPKPGTATVTVHVVKPVIVNAGNDTAVVLGQALQLQATSTTDTATYAWTPFAYLSSSATANPVANFNSNAPDTITYYVTATTPEGCHGSDAVKVVIYRTQPDIFVPTAFTPNGDGLNDVIKPILAGISHFNYFRVYNRWGQLIFETSQPNKGWDGNISGSRQASASFIFVTSGLDYRGNLVERKGTFLLIR